MRTHGTTKQAFVEHFNFFIIKIILNYPQVACKMWVRFVDKLCEKKVWP